MPGETLPAASSSLDDVKTKGPAARKAGCSSPSAGDTTGFIQISGTNLGNFYLVLFVLLNF